MFAKRSLVYSELSGARLSLRTQTGIQLEARKAKKMPRSRTAMLFEAEPEQSKLFDGPVLQLDVGAEEPGACEKEQLPVWRRSAMQPLPERFAEEPGACEKEQLPVWRRSAMQPLPERFARPPSEDDKKFAEEKRIHDSFKRASSPGTLDFSRLGKFSLKQLSL
eukprot:TRINITY_DN1828_c0_g1_i2.p1 TRINITY_DN1828_c0_g1~~TRINITY_DN1828_c0_g1_i2.p1  ORF type:complete len:182 (+),score=39.05 TRINITY_DN1828_c0_g1_i2:56-547(+)